jgi:outer membrane protein OmpA-like peptidoglycan-associated protein
MLIQIRVTARKAGHDGIMPPKRSDEIGFHHADIAYQPVFLASGPMQPARFGPFAKCPDGWGTRRLLARLSPNCPFTSKGLRMRRLINTTTILSLALYVVPPFAAQAQDFQKVTVGDKEVICLPNKAAACPDGAFCVIAKNPANCQTNAEKAVAKAEGSKATDPAATDQPATDQAAKDQAAADQAMADKLAADQAAAEKAATEKAAAEKAAADKAAADQAAADQAAADKAAADQAAADKAAADQAAGASGTETPTSPPVMNPDQQTAQTPPVMNPDQKTVTVNGTTVICLPNKAAVCPDGAVCVVAAKTAKCEELATKKVEKMTPAETATGADANATAGAGATAGADATVTAGADPAATPVLTPEQKAAKKAAAKKAREEQAAMDAASIAAAKKAQEDAAKAAAADPNIKPVEAPVPDAKAVETLATVLDAPAVADPADPSTAPEVAAAAAEGTDLTKAPADQPAPKDAKVTTETVTEADTRASGQNFTPAPATVAPGKKSGLSDLEKVGLVALGALAIGAMLKGNKEVVSNTGDRVVVRQPDGTYQVYKDDNALLREPGNKVTTQSFNDGSTRSIVTREDGSQIVTVRDASGRVLQRIAYDRNGRGTVLIDDLQPERRVDLTRLPRTQPQGNIIAIDQSDAAMRAALASANAEGTGQKFSLRQIRTIPEVRYLAPMINVNNITFETGSAAILPSEAKKLNKLGAFITQMITANPGEVFLIEGHTDAVGSAASNLALSDRRAESVAKALTEYFQVPPENLVVQGYGESELLVDSAGDERANRRVAVRIITPLLRQSAN